MGWQTVETGPISDLPTKGMDTTMRTDRLGTGFCAKK
jgi:hypothetical protein